MTDFHNDECVLSTHTCHWHKLGADFRRERHEKKAAARHAKSMISYWTAATQRHRPLALAGRTSAPGHDRPLKQRRCYAHCRPIAAAALFLG